MSDKYASYIFGELMDSMYNILFSVVHNIKKSILMFTDFKCSSIEEFGL